MVEAYDYKKYKVLFVDDEEKSCKYFTRAFGETFDIITCMSGVEAKGIFEKQHQEIGVIVTDQRMPEMTGVEFLDHANEINDSVIKILSTAYSDLDAAVDAVNRGQIYKYLTKPWEITVLEANLRRGMEFFLLKKERDELLGSKMVALERMISLSRVITFMLAPLIEEKKIDGLTTSFYQIMRSSLSVYDSLDLGFAQFFEANSSDGFYSDYISSNKDRLSKLFEGASNAELISDPIAEIAKLLDGEVEDNGEKISGIAKDALTNALQGVIGYEASESQKSGASQLLRAIVSLGKKGKIISLDGEGEGLKILDSSLGEQGIEALLDDEFMIARLGGVL